MVELQQYGYVRKKEGDKKKGYQYEVSSFEEYEQLQTRINTVLDEILATLKKEEVQKFKEVIFKNEPLKCPSVKEKKIKNKEVPGNKKETHQEKNTAAHEASTLAEQQL